MPDLMTLQDEMAVAILGGGIAHIVGEFHAGGADAGARLNIFRNNTFASLTECLKAVFPVTMKLSDERFFAYAAQQFIASQLPREARLSRYGASFPRFLAGFKPCRDFPVIAEMAALEWAVADSLNDAEELPIPIALAGGTHLGSGKTCLRLQPNLRFTVSRWPLADLWLDHKKAGTVITGSLKPRVSRLAITRHCEDLQFVELEPERFAFWRSLARGRPIEEAAARALARDRLFDLVRETLLLFRSNLVTGAFMSI